VSTVLAVSRSPEHLFSKDPQPSIRLLAGLGVEGDAHAGVTVRHRSRVAADPTQANLRQVHLMMGELLQEVEVEPGALGENITTTGLDLPKLGLGTLLHLGGEAVVQITGLRNPCIQIQAYRPGLLKQVVSTDAEGVAVRRAGVMSVVLVGGLVHPGAQIRVVMPPVHVALERV
jgi:MOSC domain-containing protein YiiM